MVVLLLVLMLVLMLLLDIHQLTAVAARSG